MATIKKKINKKPYLWGYLNEIRIKSLPNAQPNLLFSFDGHLSSKWRPLNFQIQIKHVFMNHFEQNSSCIQFLLISRSNFDDQLCPSSYFQNGGLFEIFNWKKISYLSIDLDEIQPSSLIKTIRIFFSTIDIIGQLYHLV